ncbi:universal stress protein [Jiella sp. M17.18]|uniref:universal stress protein n=1 Tax=Jiella sp. M17.18 TaxID=3234247 RepID=UPI0034DF5D57
MYKTILVCLDSKERAEGLLDLALPLAERQGAHLVGLHITPSVFVNLATEVSVRYLEETQKSLRADAEAIKAIFDKRVAASDISAEWRLEEPVDPAYERVVTRHALCADLIVAGQPHASEWNGGALVTDILIETGRPILFVPYAGRFETVGREVTIAWNGTREAARAAFDAVPLIADARSVRILAVDPQRQSTKAGLAPADDLALVLARHGIRAEAASSYSGEISVGDDLLSGLADAGSDLLVMGCYGHSRVREMLFGGVTRHILQHMTVPVFMSR